MTHNSFSSDRAEMARDGHSVSDAELLRRSDEDGEAFGRLYDRHVESIFTWCRARAGEAAADMTAEVFARAWLSRARFRDEANGSAGPWLFGIAGNLYRDWLRRKRVETSARRRLGLPELADDPALERVDERLSLPADALAAITSLPPADRDALELRVVEDRPYSEVASRLECTPQAARLRVSRALRRLHTNLKEGLG
jgi:RNA polymerase sigma-70 factor (ECF subfamily)